jgi:sensor histidine kinase YesM
MTNLLTFDDKHFTSRRIIFSLLINAVINTVIAAMLTAIDFGRGFGPNLVFSQCIGMSIYAANLAAIPLYRTVTRASYQLMIIVAAVVLGALVGTVLGAAANGFGPTFFLREYAGFFIQIVLIGLLFGAIVSYVFISLARISEEKMKRLGLEKNAALTELKLLQSQMEPHFLFNTLSTVMSLMDSDPEKARRMLESFTAFLRSSLLIARSTTITLAQEMDVVKSYLAVIQVRMGSRLAFRIDLPESLRECTIAPLLIQPLVENTVKHGLEPSIGGGEVSLCAVRDNDVVRIVVADSGRGINEMGPGNGIGISNIRDRLELMYGGRGRLVLEENSPSGVKATIEIPYASSMSSVHQGK